MSDNAPPPTPSLQVRDLACRRGDRLLFSGLHFELPAGTALWLRGRNGSGKTSLLRLLAGLGRPEHGEILWGTRPVLRDEAFRRGMRYVGHANGLKDDLSASESLAFEATLHGDAATRDRIETALSAFGLAPQRRAFVRTLSQGQRRRLALARLALAPSPGLWLLDEPFDALDTDSIGRLCALLAAHQSRGGSVLLTSHQPPPQPLSAAVLDLDAARR
jgi:heme exporter protein A